MGRIAISVKEPERYELPGGGFVEFKASLTYGEEQRLFYSRFRRVQVPREGPDGEITGVSEMTEIRLDDFSFHRIATWVADWDLEGPDGKVLPISEAVVRRLDNAVAKEIDQVLDGHVAGVLQGKGPAPGGKKAIRGSRSASAAS